jgi:hypothetical protein
MNERIKLLAEQSTITRGGMRVVDIEKFAELIVRECTAALFDESERLFGLYSEEDSWNSAEEYEIRSNQCVDDIALIEKHFGVEE